MTRKAFIRAVEQEGRIYVRAYPSHGAAPLVVELDVSEALALAIDLTNKARIVVERTA